MIVQGIVIQDKTPSVVPSRELYCWTKYAVGESRGGCYRYGAIKPPNPDTDWFPAAISPDVIFVACAQTFPSPEEAVSWLRTAGQRRLRRKPATPPPQKGHGRRR